jgi:hypothetical protein
MEILNLKPSQLRVDNRVLLSDKKIIKDLKQSFEEIGVIEPITITEDYYIVSGYNRYSALSQLGREIPCIITKESNEINLQLMEIDANLIKRKLSNWEYSLLLSKKKELYEEKYPNSTKEYKSKNNAKQENERETNLPDSFSKVEANKRDCSERSIDKNISNVNKIKTKLEVSIDTLTNFEKSVERNLKGVHIDKFADLPIEDMKNANKIIEDNIGNNKFNFSQLFIENKENHTFQQQLNLILEFEVSQILNRDFDYDIKTIKKYKKSLKVDFSKTLEKLLIKE